MSDIIKKSSPDKDISVNSINRETREGKAEQEKSATISMWIVDENRDLFNSLERALRYSSSPKIDLRLIDNPVDFQQKLDKAEKGDIPDVIYLGSFSDDLDTFINWERKLAPRFITKIRNNQRLNKQPAIIRVTSDKDFLERSVQAGADLSFKLPFDLHDFIAGVSTVPELLAKIEERYGEEMKKNKEYFYKEYQDKLTQRSEITADIEKELSILDNILKQTNAKRVLDAGCGEGRIALPLLERGYQVTGVDINNDLIKRAKEKAKQAGYKPDNFFVGDLRKLPVQNSSQDAVIYNWHVFCDLLGNKVKKEVLAESFRVLKDGGVIVIDIPDREHTIDQADGVYIMDPGGKNIFIGYTPSREEMIELLKEAGFVNIQVIPWQTKSNFHKLTFVAHKEKY